MAERTNIIRGWHPEKGNLFASVDPRCRFCTGEVAEMQFAALLRPFTSEEAAVAALKEAGAGEVWS
jgi:hypothetical protein